MTDRDRFPEDWADDSSGEIGSSGAPKGRKSAHGPGGTDVTADDTAAGGVPAGLGQAEIDAVGPGSQAAGVSGDVHEPGARTPARERRSGTG